MYLAGILALCALLHVPAWGSVSSGILSFALNSNISQQPQSQEPAKNDQPAAPALEQDQPKPAPPQETKPPDNAQQPEPSPNPPSPGANPNQEATPKTEKPAAVPPKKHPIHKKHARPAPSEDPSKKVVRRGSTAEPPTQLAPGITGEQAARQRESTNQLLASTDASLQKLSARQLTQDEQDTVSQIRKFMEQVKEADKAGDLQRAYKLAVKAHLLSDALAKP